MLITAKEINEVISYSDRLKIVNWEWTGSFSDVKVGNVLKSIRVNKASSEGKLRCELTPWTGWGVRDSLSRSSGIRAGNPEIWDIQVTGVDSSKKFFDFKLVRLVFKLEDK
jgi:hypothetical protein